MLIGYSVCCSVICGRGNKIDMSLQTTTCLSAPIEMPLNYLYDACKENKLEFQDAGHTVSFSVVPRNEKLIWHNSIQLGHVSL